MTQEELVKRINQLPIEDRIALRDAIAKSINETVDAPKTTGSIVEQLSGTGKTEISGAMAENGHSSLSETLYGILQFEPGPPSDEEVKNMIADYLVKKYY